jgi:uncharacterized glyoxalase superfamily protein PhnB
MTVKRIVPNFRLENPAEAKAFYQEVLGLDPVMDQGWIVTFAAPKPASPQISMAAQGGSGTDVPDVSIEVDDVDAAYERARRFGAEIVYDLTNEDWGVRRFYVRDPCGKVLNILAHV